jgi:ATP-dependent Lhr-like helicase
MAGASVILLDGAPAAYLARGERQLLTFLEQVPDRDPTEVAAAIARCLADQVAPGKRRSLFLREVDGRPTAETPLATALIAAGFTHGPHGFMKRL